MELYLGLWVVMSRTIWGSWIDWLYRLIFRVNCAVDFFYSLSIFKHKLVLDKNTLRRVWNLYCSLSGKNETLQGCYLNQQDLQLTTSVSTKKGLKLYNGFQGTLPDWPELFVTAWGVEPNVMCDRLNCLAKLNRLGYNEN